MLVLTRKLGQKVRIFDGTRSIGVTVKRVQGGRVQLLFDGPPDLVVLRQELVDQESAAAEDRAAIREAAADPQGGGEPQPCRSEVLS